MFFTVVIAMLVSCSSDKNTSSELDVGPPTITILGENPVTISVGEPYYDTGATAQDEVDGIVSIIVDSNVQSDKIGQYTVIFSAVDKAGNESIATRIVNVIEKDTATQLMNDMAALQSDNTPFTTEAELVQSEFAKNNFPTAEAKRLERLHYLVAIAEDPDPDWFYTYVDRPVYVGKQGDSFTAHLTKRTVDDLDLGPVTNEQLRFVVRIQRSDDDFEYVPDHRVADYVEWTGDGVVEVKVPDDLTQGRLVVGVRPNFEDVAQEATAERWSTVLFAEIWKLKADVKTLSRADVLFPIVNADTVTIAADSVFNRDEITQATQERLAVQEDFNLPIVIKNHAIQMGDKLSYFLGEQPYSGIVQQVIERDGQYFALMSPELFEVYEITGGEAGVLTEQGLAPENVVYRDGEVLPSETDESDPTEFSKPSSPSERADDEYKFVDVSCSEGRSVFTINPIFDLSEADLGLDIRLNALGENEVSCSLTAKTRPINLTALLNSAGPAAIVVRRLLGAGIIATPFGELKLAAKTPLVGINFGASLNKGGHLKFSTLDSLLSLTDRLNLEADTPRDRSELGVGASVGLKIEVEGFSGEGDIALVLSFLRIEVNDLGVEGKAVLEAGGKLEALSASEVYESKEPSSMTLSLGINLEARVSKGAGNLFRYLGLFKLAEFVAKVNYKLIDDVKLPIYYTYSEVADDSKGSATVHELALENKFFEKINPFETLGVMAPENTSSSVFNDKASAVSYENEECQASANGHISSPIIACSGIFCGQVTKPARLCVGKIAIGSIFLETEIDTTVEKDLVLVNNGAGDVTVDIDALPVLAGKVQLPIKNQTQETIRFFGACGDKSTVKRGRTIASVAGNDDLKEEVENILVCYRDDRTTFGDPHIITADGLGYDYYASGDYIMSRIEGVDDYSVQARFLPGFETSWPQAVALQVGSDVIEVQGITEISSIRRNSLKVFINGQLSLSYSKRLPSGGRLFVTGLVDGSTSAMTVVWPSSSQANGYAVRISVAGGVSPFIDFNIIRPLDFQGKEEGLLGNFNNDPTDDFKRRNGEVLTADGDLSFTELYGLFGADWLIRPNESLFRNSNAIKPTFPSKVVELTPAQRDFGEQACLGLVGFYYEACVLDVGLSNNVDLIKEYYANTADLNDWAQFITAPPVTYPIYKLEISNLIFDEDIEGVSHRSAAIKKVTGEGGFLLLLRPPRGAKVSFPNGLASLTGYGDVSTNVSLDCSTTYPETDNDLYMKTGSIQLWAQDPLSGGAGRLYDEQGLSCENKRLLSGQKECFNFSTYEEEACTEEHLGQDGHHESRTLTSVRLEEILGGEMISDRLTGLMWQNDALVTTPYDSGVFSHGERSAVSVVPGTEPIEIPDPVDLSIYKNICSSLELGQFNDWRVPTPAELFSIINFGFNNSQNHALTSMDRLFKIPETLPISYLSLDDYRTQGLWLIDFRSKRLGNLYSSSDGKIYLRCVRNEY